MTIIPTAALGQHIAVLGKTRSGKTNSAKLVIEQVAAAGSRVCVIDPIKADYWGLTSSADGKRPGLPFHIVGGQHGHVPLHSSAGAAIAEVVASGALKLSIIDMEAFGPRESGPFFAAFMETIFRRIQGVLYLVVDEAHLFAPKEGRGGDESMATYWFKRMASGSGSKGVRLLVSTQRVQDLHNTVLSNCDTVIAHRVTFPEDQKRISEWVASHAAKELVAEVKRSLPNLHRGEAWICSGEAGIFERRQLPLCSTYDNSRTPTEDDQRREVKTASIDREALRSIIGDAVKEAEANDPKVLRKKIADLESQVYKSAKAVQADPQIIEKAVSAALAKRDREWEQAIRERDGIIGSLKGRMGKAAALLSVNGEAEPKTATPRAPSMPSAAVPQGREHSRIRRGAELERGGRVQTLQTSPAAHSTKANQTHQRAAGPSPALTELQLTKAQGRILDALAWYESIGVASPSTLQVGAVAMIDSTGGYWSNMVGPLSTAGLVERGTGSLSLTDAGREVAQVPANIGTLAEYHEMLRDRVRRTKSAGGKTVEMLDAIIAANGESLTTAEIGEAVQVDHTGGYFSNMIGPLGTLGLIDRKSGVVTATKLLFPEGVY